MTPTSADLIEALHDVVDPEIPVSIVDMGLLVSADVDGDTARIRITLTSMGCPGVDMILEDIQDRVGRVPGIERVRTDIVWEPIWTKERLSEEARMQLRELGISV